MGLSAGLTDQAGTTRRQLRHLGFLDGVFLSFTLPTSGSKTVRHGLGRYPVGWIVVDIKADASIASPLRRDSWNAESVTITNDNAQDIEVRILLF